MFAPVATDGIGTTASLSYPAGLAITGTGDVLYVAESTGAIRRVYVRSGAVDTLVAPATTTVIFNGVVVQDHVEFMGITAHGSRAKYASHPSTGFIKLQDHGDPIKFANMWVRPLPVRAPAW